MNIIKTTIAATLLMGGVAHADSPTTGKMLLEFCMSGRDTQKYALGLGYVIGAMEANLVASALGGQVKMCAPAGTNRERYVRVCKSLYELDSEPGISIDNISAAVLIGMEYACSETVIDNLAAYEQSR